MHRPLGQRRAEFTTCNLVRQTLVVKPFGGGGENVSALLAVELVGGRSINVCHILCQKQCNCSPLNQQGVRWAGSDEHLTAAASAIRSRVSRLGDRRDDLKPESLLKS